MESRKESVLHTSNMFLFGIVVDDIKISDAATKGKVKKLPGRNGVNNQLGEQFYNEDSKFARIYAFSFEGAFCELPCPALFLVHGEGEEVSPDNKPGNLAARAPNSPLITGLSAADFQFADDVRFWSYDKDDYSIRMDVETGMFEQLLLDAAFGGDGFGGMAGANMRGANVRGANVRGANVRGANVRGANVRGANVRGANVRGGGGGD